MHRYVCFFCDRVSEDVNSLNWHLVLLFLHCNLLWSFSQHLVCWWHLLATLNYVWTGKTLLNNMNKIVACRHELSRGLVSLWMGDHQVCFCCEQSCLTDSQCHLRLSETDWAWKQCWGTFSSLTGTVGDTRIYFRTVVVHKHEQQPQKKAWRRQSWASPHWCFATFIPG